MHLWSFNNVLVRSLEPGRSRSMERTLFLGETENKQKLYWLGIVLSQCVVIKHRFQGIPRWAWAHTARPRGKERDREKMVEWKKLFGIYLFKNSIFLRFRVSFFASAFSLFCVPVDLLVTSMCIAVFFNKKVYNTQPWLVSGWALNEKYCMPRSDNCIYSERHQ